MLSSDTPKKQWNLSHFFALPSKSGRIEKKNYFIVLSKKKEKKPIKLVFLGFYPLFRQLLRTFQKLGQKNEKNFPCFLGGKRRQDYFAFDIYCPTWTIGSKDVFKTCMHTGFKNIFNWICIGPTSLVGIFSIDYSMIS